MYNYCKRNKYLKKIAYGKNNKGHISIRNRQKSIFKTNYCKNINYNFILKKNINIINNIIKLKIVKTVLDYRLQRKVYQTIILNSLLKNQYKYIPITYTTKEGDILSLSKNSSLKKGNILLINNIPYGNWIHNIESIQTKGAVFVKNSKISAYLITLGKKYATIKLPSGEIRLINKNVFCIYGELNASPLFLTKFKAGTNRLLGRRPKVRGVAMNACDHPHGGGEGKSSIGRSSIYSPWGIISRGVSTRNIKKYSTKLILRKN